jgi:hypothetical protein
MVSVSTAALPAARRQEERRAGIIETSATATGRTLFISVDDESLRQGIDGIVDRAFVVELGAPIKTSIPPKGHGTIEWVNESGLVVTFDTITKPPQCIVFVLPYPTRPIEQSAPAAVSHVVIQTNTVMLLGIRNVAVPMTHQLLAPTVLRREP